MAEIITEKCALCLNVRPLMESHILPKFNFRMLKKTSLTGHMRSNSNPNTRVQDGLKEYMLCSECEQKFSVLEKKFADKVFYPLYKDEENFCCQYEGAWLRKFLISVAWRYLEDCIRKNSFEEFTENEIEEIKTKVESWRRYLNDEEEFCSDVVRLLPFSKKYRDQGLYPKEIYANYFLRTSELNKTIINDGSWGFVYIKMPYLAGCVDFVNKGHDYPNTFQLSDDRGLLFNDCDKIPDLISDIMQTNNRYIIEAQDANSDQQRKMILKDALKNWDSFERSETGKAFIQMGLTKNDLKKKIEEES